MGCGQKTPKAPSKSSTLRYATAASRRCCVCVWEGGGASVRMAFSQHLGHQSFKPK